MVDILSLSNYVVALVPIVIELIVIFSKYVNLTEGFNLGGRFIHASLLSMSPDYNRYWKNLFSEDKYLPNWILIFSISTVVVITALNFLMWYSSFSGVMNLVVISITWDFVLIPSLATSIMIYIRTKANRLMKKEAWTSTNVRYYVAYILSPGLFLIFIAAIIGLFIAISLGLYIDTSIPYPFESTFTALAPFYAIYFALWLAIVFTKRNIEFTMFNIHYRESPIEVIIEFRTNRFGKYPQLRGTISKMGRFLYVKDRENYIHNVNWKSIREISVLNR